MVKCLKKKLNFLMKIMRTYFDDYRTEPLRPQPYFDSNHRSPGQYYDLRTEPEKIRTHLEEFFPYSEYQSVQEFYDLVEWLNGEDSIYETNDCRLEDLAENKQRDIADNDFVRTGTLSWFFRDLNLNLSKDSEYWSNLYQTHQINADGFRLTPNYYQIKFMDAMHLKLLSFESEIVFDCIAIAPYNTFYEYAEVDHPFKHGCQIAHRFWIWGDSDKEIFERFNHTVKAFETCFKSLNDFSFIKES